MRPGPSPLGRQIRPWIAVAIVALAAIVPYLGTLRHGFVWDDGILVESDHRIRSLGAALGAFREDFFGDAGHMGYYRPVVTLSFALDYRLGRSNPFGYHLTNVSLHALVALLVLATLRQWGAAPRVACLGAVLFAVHPAHTENVAWISGRTDILAAAFALASVWLLGIHDARASARASPESRWHRLACAALLVGSAGCCALALLSKEIALALPVVLVLDRWLRRPRDGRSSLAILPHLTITVGYLLVRVLLVPPAMTRVPLDATLRSFLASLPKYLGLFLVPAELTAYRRNPYSGWSDPLWILGAIGAAGIAFAALRPRTRWRPAERLAVLGTLATFAPLSNLIRVSSPADMGFTMADRFLYFPSIGLSAIAASLLVSATASLSGRARTGCKLAIGASILGLAMTTLGRNRVWQSDVMLFEATRATTDDAFLVDVNYAMALRRDGDLARSIALLEEKDAATRPGSRNEQAVRLALAGAYAANGETERARQMLLALRGSTREPAPVLYDLGLLDESAGRARDALAWYRSAAEADAKHIPTWVRVVRLADEVGERDVACAALVRLRVLDPHRTDWAELDPGCPSASAARNASR